MSATVTAPCGVTANAPLALPADIVNPAFVGESPVDARVTTAAPFDAVSSIVGAAAVMSITTLVTVIVYVTALASFVPSPTVIVYTYTPSESASACVSKSGRRLQLTVRISSADILVQENSHVSTALFAPCEGASSICICDCERINCCSLQLSASSLSPAVGLNVGV